MGDAVSHPFKVGDRVRLSPEWIELMDGRLDERQGDAGTVTVVGGPYKNLPIVGVHWDNGHTSMALTSNLELVT
jgi:small-conductance mechanosensitive channel